MSKRKFLYSILVGAGLSIALVTRMLSPYWVRAWYVLPTMDCMTSLMSALAVEQPYFVNADVLRTVGDKHGFVRCHEDAWGHPFEVEYAPGVDPPYRITSLGRDGKRGSCCRYLVEDVNEDAVRQGNEWLQVWRTLGKPLD
jgi:hypothetical protein